MKLYELPRNTEILIKLINKEGSIIGYEKILFHKIDGAYSYCTTNDNNVIHLGASCEIEINEFGDYILL